jgi:hypothetical protein
MLKLLAIFSHIFLQMCHTSSPTAPKQSVRRVILHALFSCREIFRLPVNAVDIVTVAVAADERLLSVLTVAIAAVVDDVTSMAVGITELLALKGALAEVARLSVVALARVA